MASFKIVLTSADTLIAAKNARLNPEPLVWLVELDASALSIAGNSDDILLQWQGADVARYALHDADITYDGHLYRSIAAKVEDSSHTPGALLEQMVTIFDPERRVAAAVRLGVILNQSVTMKRVSVDALSDTAHHETYRYLVTAATVTAGAVSFKLGSFVLMAQMLPKSRFLRYRCRFVFKEATTCGYVGAETTCDKTYDLATGCAGRNNQPRYGGQPSLLSGPNPWLLN